MNRSGARLIFDLYDPEVFENLATFADGGSRLNPLWLSLTLDRLTSALHMATTSCARARLSAICGSGRCSPSV